MVGAGKMLELLTEFFTQNGYVFEILAAVILFSFFFPNRRLFWVRFAGCIAVAFALSIGWSALRPVIESSEWGMVLYNIIKYIASFTFVVGGILFCKRVGFWGALFSGIGATASQHISYRIFSVILSLARMDFGGIGPFFIGLVVMAAVYAIVWFLMVRKVRHQPEQCFENRMNIVLGGILIFFAIVLQFLIEPFVPMKENPLLFTYISLYSLICSVCTLLLEYGFFYNRMLVKDNAVLDHIVHSQEEQYRVAKENIDMINVKCHDMKHQMSKIAGGMSPEAVKEMEDVISIYDMSLKTGNEILDVFLAEKKLLCGSSDTKLDCLVDGKCLEFMQPSDIYSLLGNALDNALEACRKLPDKGKRIIGLKISSALGMAVIHTENFFEGDLEFMAELPVTTKQDKRFHGYGMKSMQKTVEKYGGSMSVNAESGVFNLNIIIPIPSGEVAGGDSFKSQSAL